MDTNRNLLARESRYWLSPYHRPLKSMRLLAFALPLICTVPVLAADVAYTPPIGGMQVTFNPGTRFTGMTLVNPAVARGAVSAVSGNVITLSDTNANIGASLTSGTAYYVEFTAGPTTTYVGDRFDVDVTATKGSANNTLTISLASRNTLGAVPSTADLSGYSLVVRPHVTIGQILGTKANQLMQGSAGLATADQIRFINAQSQAWEIYYFLKNSSGSVAQWTKVGGGSTNRDGEIIPPGTGFVVVRNTSAPVTLTWTGEVRTNSFAQPLVAGKNLVAQPWPTSASPIQRQMTHASGMKGATGLSLADQIHTNTSGAYQIYYLLRNSSGSIEQWTLVGGGSTNRGNEALFGSSTGVIVSKISADSNYIVPYIY